MKTCRCLIIEDSPQFCTLLNEYLGWIPFMTEPAVAGTLSEGIRLLQEPFDLILLDILLPDQSGMSLLGAYPNLPPVIIMSSSPDYAVDCYDLNVADYLLKPFSFARFLRAVNRAIGNRNEAGAAPTPQKDWIFLKVGHAVQRFDFADIAHIQAYGIYSKVVCGNRVTVVNETISFLEAALPAAQFMRVHKSYIVNLKKVAMYSHRTIVIETTEVPLGAAYRDRFRAFLGLDRLQES